MRHDPVSDDGKVARRLQHRLPVAIAIGFVVIGNVSTNGVFGPTEDFALFVCPIIPQNREQAIGLEHSANLGQTLLRVGPMKRLCRDCPALGSIGQSTCFERALEPTCAGHIASPAHLVVGLDGSHTELPVDEQLRKDAGAGAKIDDGISWIHPRIIDQQIEQRLGIGRPGTAVGIGLLGEISQSRHVGASLHRAGRGPARCRQNRRRQTWLQVVRDGVQRQCG